MVGSGRAYDFRLHFLSETQREMLNVRIPFFRKNRGWVQEEKAGVEMSGHELFFEINRAGPPRETVSPA